jgi:acetyl-CoA acetyltransferase
MAFVTDKETTFNSDHLNLVGCEMTRRCVSLALREAKLDISSVDVIELHDSNSVQELISYEALGICEEGKAKDAIDEGRFTLGGIGPVVNPSGGLIARGHPIGATGVA